MLNLPKGIIHVLRYFEESFSERIWQWASVLLIGAILAPDWAITAISLSCPSLSIDRSNFIDYQAA
ncbi:MAG: hypothetical protein J2P37_30315 [Ktedonobacteraceae bacterium]|nr:hypothetical protein [Ktedonobacteraceae bacterium]MBO0793651.1 hypothetical protein [Ktedonobacteraceae bacterium]